MIDIAEIYNEYGNFRLAARNCTKAKELLTKTNQLNDHLKARIGLVEAEAMTGQGFCKNAIASIKKPGDLLMPGRAVEKETTVDGTTIKTQRVPDAELPRRYSDYAKLFDSRLMANAVLVRKGICFQADSAFSAAAQTGQKKSKVHGRNQPCTGSKQLSLCKNAY